MVGVGGWVVLAGVVVFFAGAAYGVPAVFTTRSAEDRLTLLRQQPDVWRRAQWLYAGGPVVVSAGVLVLAAGWSGPAGVITGVAGTAMLAGAALWSLSCARRGTRIEEFARGQLPAGPWLGYVWLTLAGMAGLGVATIGLTMWVGVLLLVSAVAFGAIFVVMRDIPPFLFYLVLGVVGGWAAAVQPG